jgi:hypothetical protein
MSTPEKAALETELRQMSTRLIGIALTLPEPWRVEALGAAGKLVQLKVGLEMSPTPHLN